MNSVQDDIRISVVIPSYNRAASVGRAIESVLAQTYPASEIILVDDGSTDRTSEVCSEFGSRVKYVWQQNAGASAARNQGVHCATAPWIAFLDSDDYWSAHHLERLATAIEKTQGQASFYFSDLQMKLRNHETTLWQLANFCPPTSICMTSDGTNWAF